MLKKWKPRNKKKVEDQKPKPKVRGNMQEWIDVQEKWKKEQLEKQSRDGQPMII